MKQLRFGDIKGGKNVYVALGDINTGPSLALNDFSALRQQFIRHYLAATFTGRETELRALDRWLERAQVGGPQLAVLVAPAGRGKSALVTRWFAELGKREDLHVIFVPISGRFHTNRPDIVLPTLAAELSDFLNDPADIPSIGSIDAYRDVVAQLFAQIGGSGKRCVLILDGIDETQLSGWDLGASLLPSSPPGGLCILATARRLAGDKDAVGWKHRLGWSSASVSVEEIDLSKLALEEVSSLLTELVAESEPSAQLTAELYRLSEDGDPLLVELYANDVRQAINEGNEGIGEIIARLRQQASGLGAYFDNWLNEQKAVFAVTTVAGSLSFAVVESTLLILAAAWGPLHFPDIVQLLRYVVPDEHIPAKSITLAPLARFVIGTDVDGGSGYTLGHPLFGSFLQEHQYNGTPLLDKCRKSFLVWGRDLISQLRSRQRNPSDVPKYLLDLYAQHLVRQKAGTVSSFLGVLSVEWIEACRLAHKETSFAVATNGVVEALIQDIGRSDVPAPELVAAAVRASLFLASFRQAASFTDPSLLIAAIEHGVLDQQTALARQALAPPSKRIEMSLALARSGLPGTNSVALWREARLCAMSDQSSDSPALLSRVLIEADLAFRIEKDDAAIELREEYLTSLQLLLTVDHLQRFPPRIISRSVTVYFTETMLSRLALVILEYTADLAHLPVLFCDFSRAVPSTLSLRSVLFLLSSNPKYGRVVTSVAAVLENSKDSKTLASLLDECATSHERLLLAAVVLGILFDRHESTSVAQLALETLVNESDAVFVVRLIQSAPLGKLSITQEACRQAWIASKEILQDHDRISVRAKILERMTYRIDVFPRVAEEVRSSINSLKPLIDAAVPKLSGPECAALLELFPESVRGNYTLSSLVKKLDKDDKQHWPTQNSESESYGRDRFDEFMDAHRNTLSEDEFDEALSIVRSVENSWRRANCYTNLLRRSPKKRSRELIVEALSEGNAIGDEEASRHAIIRLMTLANPVNQDGLSQLLGIVVAGNPESAVRSITNASWRLPPGDRASWMSAAIQIIEKIPYESDRRVVAMARVVNTFGRPAPLKFTVQALAGVNKIPDDLAFDVYRDLVWGRHPMNWLSAVVAVARYRTMSAELRFRVSYLLRKRFPKLLLWLRPNISSYLVSARRNEATLTAILDWASIEGGVRRTRLVEQFAMLMREPKKVESPFFPSKYAAIRNLYEQSDVPTRSRIKDAIKECPDASLRLYYSVCLFPALSSDERAKVAPQLLKQILSAFSDRSTRESAADREFMSLYVLLLNWPNNDRRRALTELLRAGCYVTRYRWFYDISDIAELWKPDARPQLTSSLLAATQDSIRIWP